MIKLETAQFGNYLIRNTLTDETVLVQSDWDYPSVAQSFGFGGLCTCGSSDGTVDCPCASIGQHMRAAVEWLDDNIGVQADDPGYFEKEK